MHDRWSRYHMSREILQVSAKGVLCRFPGPGIGDREARCGVSLWIERPRRVCCRDAERLTLRETWINLVARWLQSSNRRVLADAGGRRSYERICGRLQFRCLKHELQIKHDV